MKKCVFAGTFDPFTVGHEDTVKKCLAIFDEVTVAVATNKRKQCMFSPEERLAFVSAVYEGEPRVRVLLWDGAMAELLKKENTPFYARGLRNMIDFDYETADFYASRDISPEMITLYIPAEQRNMHVSSTLVRNCILFGTPCENYVPEAVYRLLQRGKYV